MTLQQKNPRRKESRMMKWLVLVLLATPVMAQECRVVVKPQGAAFLTQYFYPGGNKNTEPFMLTESTPDKSTCLADSAPKIGKVNGQLTTWHVNGKKAYEASYVAGKLHGKAVRWYENGRPLSESYFKLGKNDGRWISWYASGRKKMEENYRALPNGSYQLSGFYRYWYENGALAAEAFYRQGKQDGLQREWHENGKKYKEERYLRGEPDGVWREWNRSGKLMRQSRFKNGQEESVLP
jgi:antitoxin component YwqK of YwqJK toxin-antitoxin module